MNSFGLLSINERLPGIVERCNWRGNGSGEDRSSPTLYTLGHTGGVLRAAGRGRLREDDGSGYCRRADINRGTFYLHYEDKFALLDALIDEALAAAPPIEGTETGALCQRPPANDDYYLLYSDDDAYARVAQRVVERGAEQMVPSIMEETGLSREDAYLLFVHNVQGNLAVNRLLGWKRGPEFAHAQELLSAYSEGGMRAVSAPCRLIAN